MRELPEAVLLLQTKLGDESVVLFDIRSLEIAEKILPSGNLDVHTTLGRVVMLVEGHVDRQLLDLLRKDGDLDFDGTSVLLISAIAFNRLRLFFFCKSHFSLPHFSLPIHPAQGEYEDRALFQKIRLEYYNRTYP